MNQLFHHTDSAHLPYILRAGELRPGRNAIGGFPDPDFLWATTDARGDSTASSLSGPGLSGYRQGMTLAVRFRLDPSDFEGWPEITARFPAWTPQEITRLERATPGATPRNWRCRAEALPQARWLGIETRSYRRPQWRPFTGDVIANGPALGIHVDGALYYAQQFVQPGGGLAYAVGKEIAA